MTDSMTAALRLGAGYHPRPYAGRLALFNAAACGPYERGWTGLSTEQTAHALPGIHLGMLEEPVVAQTASLVDQSLRSEVDTERDSPAGQSDRSRIVS